MAGFFGGLSAGSASAAGAGGLGSFASGLANFAGGGGGGGGGQTGDLSPMLKLLQQLKFSVRKSGGGGFGFDGQALGQQRERQQLQEQLMQLLQGPQATGQSAGPVQFVGGQGSVQDAETSMAGGLNTPGGTGFSLSRPGGSQFGFFDQQSRLGAF